MTNWLTGVNMSWITLLCYRYTSICRNIWDLKLWHWTDNFYLISHHTEPYWHKRRLSIQVKQAIVNLAAYEGNNHFKWYTGVNGKPNYTKRCFRHQRASNKPKWCCLILYVTWNEGWYLARNQRQARLGQVYTSARPHHRHTEVSVRQNIFPLPRVGWEERRVNLKPP